MQDDLNSDLIADIVQAWRMRQAWIKAETKLILQGKAICRDWTDGDKTKANKLFDNVMKENASDPLLALSLMPFMASLETFSKARKEHEKVLKNLVRQLPVWAWVKGVKGMAEIGLAAIVGEAGDLSDYDSIAKLWKRLGLAVMNGKRQGSVEDGLSPNERKEAYIIHGYSPHRRAAVFANVGDPLIKSNGDGPYRQVYLERKADELARNPEMTPMHAHRRAQRYMEKRLLKNLWQAWRRAIQTVPAMAKETLPASEVIRDAA